MQNCPHAAMPSRSPHCARQSNAQLAAGLGLGLALQARLGFEVAAAATGVATARAGRPATLVNSTMPASVASASTRLNSSCASHSAVTANGVPSCACRAERLHARDVGMAADAAGGDDRPPRARCPALRRKASDCGIAFSKSKRESARSATLAAPGDRRPGAGARARSRRADASCVHLRTTERRRARRTGWARAARRDGPVPGRAGPAAALRQPRRRRCRIQRFFTDGAYSPTRA